MHATEYVEEQKPGYMFWAQVQSYDSLEWKLVMISAEDGIRTLHGKRVRVAQIHNTTSYWMKYEDGSYSCMMSVPKDVPHRELPWIFRIMAEEVEAKEMDTSNS